MRELDQRLLDFGISESFDENDYYISKSNYFASNLIKTWPRWEKKIVNIGLKIRIMINSDKKRIELSETL